MIKMQKGHYLKEGIVEENMKNNSEIANAEKRVKAEQSKPSLFSLSKKNWICFLIDIKMIL